MILIRWLFLLFIGVVWKLIFRFFFFVLVLFMVVSDSLFGEFLMFSSFMRDRLVMVMLEFEFSRLKVVIWLLDLLIIWIGII